MKAESHKIVVAIANMSIERQLIYSLLVGLLAFIITYFTFSKPVLVENDLTLVFLYSILSTLFMIWYLPVLQIACRTSLTEDSGKFKTGYNWFFALVGFPIVEIYIISALGLKPFVDLISSIDNAPFWVTPYNATMFYFVVATLITAAAIGIVKFLQRLPYMYFTRS